jgi:hypothetical protein
VDVAIYESLIKAPSKALFEVTSPELDSIREQKSMDYKIYGVSVKLGLH